MKSTTIYKKWDIVLVTFPFTDLSTSKKRPALIVSPNKHNKSNNGYVIALVTSNISTQPRLGDYLISEWSTIGLPKPSLIRMRFATLDGKMIIKKIGGLTRKDIKEFAKLIYDFFIDT